MCLMKLTKEEIQLLDKFQSVFKVKANSMALQTVTIDSSGAIHYDDTIVYGETAVLDIFYEDRIVASIENPRNDMEEILEFAKQWKQLGYPMPDENSKLFNN